MIFEHEPLCLLPTMAPHVESLAAQAKASRLGIPASSGRLGQHVAFVELPPILLPSNMIDLRMQFAELGANPAVGSVAVLVDCVGGVVMGTAELAEIVARVAKQKPVHCFIEGYGTSGAYWAVCNCTSITVSPSALVGSFGVVVVIIDSSEAARLDGLRVLPIATGKLKALGVPGVPVDDEMIAAVRHRCQLSADRFHLAISKARRIPLDDVIELSTGEVWSWGFAKKLRLADSVALYEDWVVNLLQSHSKEGKDEDLRGPAAIAKWKSMVVSKCASFGNDLAEYNRVQEALEREFPQLSAAAYAAEDV